MQAKRIVIIGGGIAGLTAGIYAMRAGFQSVLCEKHTVLGGECTGWDRQGYYIDNCIHWMMGTRPGSALNALWYQTGALGDDVEVLRADRMYTSELHGQSATLWQDMARTESELIALSPEDGDEIRSLMKACRRAENIQIPAEIPPELMGPLDLLKMGAAMKDALRLFREYDGMDIRDLMARFRHPLIRCLISDFCPKDARASSFPMAYGNFTGGDGGIPRGGSRAMAARMRARFESLGGRMLAGVSAEKILLNAGRATGVLLETGTVLPADYVIAACDTSQTFGRLLDLSYMPVMLREMYDNPADYVIYGMFQAAFAVDSPENLLPAELILDTEGLRIAPWVGDRVTVKSFGNEPSFAPPGKLLVQTMMALSADAYDDWQNLRNTDPDAYHTKKQALAQLTLEKLESRFPAWRGKFAILDVWTPATYARYCNAYKGYNQAFTITKRSAKNPYPVPWLKGLSNVVLAGQWISPPGGLPGAAITGKYAVQRILKREHRGILI